MAFMDRLLGLAREAPLATCLGWGRGAVPADVIFIGCRFVRWVMLN